MAFSSPSHGVCLSTNISVFQKEGIIWHKYCFASCVQGSCSTRYYERCSHQLAQKQKTALCCQWISGSSNQCQVMGYRQSCGSNSQGLRQWDSSFWPWCFWQCVVVATCLHQPKSVAIGTTEWTQHKWYVICFALAAMGLSVLVPTLRKFLNFLW